MSSKMQTLDTPSSARAYYAAATATTSPTRTVHISGQGGTLASTGEAPDDYASQIHLALLNLHRIILAAHASVRDIAKLTLYIVNYDPTHRLHAAPLQRFLAGHRPAVTLVPVTQLAVADWLFEIDAILAVPLEANARSSATITGMSYQPPTHPTEQVDVAIIGAGLAGLTAAHRVLQAGHSCVVLEARDRIGGRIYSHQLTGGGIVDLGAAWINDTSQSRMIALARRLGLELIEQNTIGNAVLQDADGSIKPFPYGDLPPVRECSCLRFPLPTYLRTSEPLNIPPTGEDKTESLTLTLLLATAVPRIHPHPPRARPRHLRSNLPDALGRLTTLPHNRQPQLCRLPPNIPPSHPRSAGDGPCLDARHARPRTRRRVRAVLPELLPLRRRAAADALGPKGGRAVPEGEGGHAGVCEGIGGGVAGGMCEVRAGGGEGGAAWWGGWSGGGDEAGKEGEGEEGGDGGAAACVGEAGSV